MIKYPNEHTFIVNLTIALSSEASWLDSRYPDNGTGGFC